MGNVGTLLSSYRLAFVRQCISLGNQSVPKQETLMLQCNAFGTHGSPVPKHFYMCAVTPLYEIIKNTHDYLLQEII